MGEPPTVPALIAVPLPAYPWAEFCTIAYMIEKKWWAWQIHCKDQVR